MEVFLATLLAAFATTVGKDVAGAAEHSAVRFVAWVRERVRAAPKGDAAIERAVAGPANDDEPLQDILHEQLQDPEFRSEVSRFLDAFRAATNRQVAAVCYRRRDVELEFLLVRTGGGKRWTFPKGNPDPYEAEAEAAARRAAIEGGAKGEVDPAALTDYLHLKRERMKSFPVRPYLLEVSSVDASKRETTWATPVKAKQLLAERRELQWARGLAAVVDEAVARLSGPN